MQQLRLDPGAAFKKCARVVGDVIGKFHPHGDQAVYDALVRLAQDFASRYPLIDGQGNFGNIDGDNPAAYRYTEARMTEVARLLLEGIDEDAVEFRANYDGQSKEPVVLPGAFPNLLGLRGGGDSARQCHRLGTAADERPGADQRHGGDRRENQTTHYMFLLAHSKKPSGGVPADASS
jgi:hypothetical protein